MNKPLKAQFVLLEGLYNAYNQRKFIHPDPLEFLYRYEDPADREIVGIIASCLAYGRVDQILKSITWVLERMPSPAVYINSVTKNRVKTDFKGFKHRFTTSQDLTAVLLNMQRIKNQYGSLNRCFLEGCEQSDKTVLPALGCFVDQLAPKRTFGSFGFIPHPDWGSACKRLNLFLRWMVRSDRVDPGVWQGIDPRKLLIPMDTHMHRICLMLEFTQRKQPDLKAAIEATAAFQKIVPHDPVRYDFCLTRFGIRKDLDGNFVLG